jgi:phosphopantothenoylcysteine decarboxylase/phosphopantothenate--cysteine ligase
MKIVFRDKNIVLGVCGGIAAYKSVELLRLIQKAGANIKVIMTRNAQAFVGPLTFRALSGQPVCADLFEENDDASIRHIDWAEEADAVVIAPATANIIAKMANGLADDALSTFILAVTSPILICPSMNTHMYENRAVQRNLDILEADGYKIIEPGTGELACGTSGAGRLPQPEFIFDRLVSTLLPNDFNGKKILISAGPTQEFIDPVRYISNPSSGKMGYAIARAAEHRGAEVTLVSGPSNLADPLNVKVIRVITASEMAEAVFDKIDDSDIIIKTAAVSDYRPKEVAEHKIKKNKDEIVISLEKNTDILKEIGKRKGSRILVGFAAETQDLNENAQKKLDAKNLDIIVGNIVGDPSSGFGTDTNKVTFFHKDGKREPLPEMEKDEVAHALLDRILMAS